MVELAGRIPVARGGTLSRGSGSAKRLIMVAVMVTLTIFALRLNV